MEGPFAYLSRPTVSIRDIRAPRNIGLEVAKIVQSTWNWGSYVYANVQDETNKK